MRWLADMAYLIVGLFYLPIAVYQSIVHGKHRSGWRQRFGGVPRHLWRSDSTPGRIWIHAVSLGEINATPKLVEALRALRPDADIVFSCTTDTGYHRAVALYGRDRVFRYPLDFSLVVNHVLNHLRPSMIVLVELEVWYNLVRLATRRGIPVAVVNGRLTARSAKRLSRLGAPVRPMFADLAWVGAQDETIAGRFHQLGVRADRLEVTSSMKWDTASVSETVAGAAELALAMGIDRSAPILVCGSTGPGEEEIILNAHRTMHPSPALILVPRKPERFDEVAALIERAGFTCVRRSQRPDGSAPPPPDSAKPSVLLGDTMGELRKFYSLADVVFVGRSLVPMGGSDPMEVAALGKPIVVGPHMENFEAPARELQKEGALRIVHSAPRLSETISDWLKTPDRASAIGSRGRDVVLRNQGATRRTADRLIALLR